MSNYTYRNDQYTSELLLGSPLEKQASISLKNIRNQP